MLQLRTIEPHTLDLLKALMQIPILASHFLVGGTSLALQMGHRYSVDLDLFSHQAFDAEAILTELNKHFRVQPLTINNTIFICVVDGIKVDLVHFRYPFAYPIIQTEGVRLADIRDIAPMKLDAVTKRGSKKDFFDMYYLFERYSLNQILEFYQQMFRHSTSFHVIRSLTYFEDAETSEMPIIFDTQLTWQAVKNKMIETVKAIL